MDFKNESPWPAELVRSALSPDDDAPVLAICVLKVTYDILPDGSLRVAEEQHPVVKEPGEGDWGWTPQDTVPQKPGVDIFVLGHARNPEGGAVRSMTVRLQVGQEVRDLAVFGDRYWVRGPEGIAPTEPEPFQTMPITYDRAYGGAAAALDYETPYPYNPAGRGFVLEEEHAHGVLLPNVEDPAHRITSWSDQPVPAGFAPVPLSSLFTLDRGVDVDRERGTQRVKPEVFQSAHPSLVFDDLPAGLPVGLHGMGPEGRLAFRLPEIRARVTARFDEEEYEVDGRVDTLCILADESRFFLVHRWPFKYRVVPGQLRTTTLHVESVGAPEP